MSLTGQQKKIIRKKIRDLSIEEISDINAISREEIIKYLKHRWGKKKYNRFVENIKAKKSQRELAHFSIGGWLRERRFILLGLATLVFMLYLNSLGNDFVSDDISWIPSNPNLGKISFLLSLPDRVGMWAVIFLAHWIGNLNPIVYRLFNIFFHISNTLLVFLILDLIGGKRLATIGSTIFAVHPILIESVAWIAGGSYAEYSFFILFALLLYLLFIRLGHKKLYIASLISAAMSLLFSEQAVIVAGVFFLYELSFGSLRKNWKRLIGFFAISLSSVIHLSKGIEGRVTGLVTQNYLERGYNNPLLQIPIAISEYLKLILFPKALTLYHSEVAILSKPEYLVRVAVLVLFFSLILLVFVKSRKSNFKAKYLFFWLSFFVLALTPTLTPLKVAWVVAERYVYLGSIGIIAAVALFFDKLSENGKTKNAVTVICIGIVTILGVRTIVRNIDWKNQDNLWISTAKTSPSSPNTHNNMGDVYGRRGEYQKAIEEFEEAIKIKPDYADAYHNLANTQRDLFNQDKEKNKEYSQKAIDNYLLAIKYNPRLWQSYQNLAVIYFDNEEYDKAIEYINRAVEIEPSNLNLKYNLGVIYLKSGDSKKAKEMFLLVTKQDPNNQKAAKMLNEIK